MEFLADDTKNKQPTTALVNTLKCPYNCLQLNYGLL